MVFLIHTEKRQFEGGNMYENALWANISELQMLGCGCLCVPRRCLVLVGGVCWQGWANCSRTYWQYVTVMTQLHFSVSVYRDTVIYARCLWEFSQSGEGNSSNPVRSKGRVLEIYYCYSLFFICNLKTEPLSARNFRVNPFQMDQKTRRFSADLCRN